MELGARSGLAQLQRERAHRSVLAGTHAPGAARPGTSYAGASQQESKKHQGHPKDTGSGPFQEDFANGSNPPSVCIISRSRDKSRAHAIRPLRLHADGGIGVLHAARWLKFYVLWRTRVHAVPESGWDLQSTVWNHIGALCRVLRLELVSTGCRLDEHKYCQGNQCDEYVCSLLLRQQYGR